MEIPHNIFELLDVAKANNVSETDVYGMVSALLEQKARESATPFHGHFELTPLCNLNCKMCYVHLNEEKLEGKRLLSADAWIQLIKQAVEAGMAHATLSGGECLTYPGFEEVYCFLKAKGIRISVLTNGVLLDERRIDFFKRNTPQKIQITMYGDSEDAYEQVTGSRVFKTVLENIIAAKAEGLPVIIAITPSRYMAETVKDTIKMVKDLNIPYVINSGLMKPRRDTGREIHNHDDLSIEEYIEIFKYECMLNNNTLEPNQTVEREKGRETDVSYSGLKCGAGRSMFSIRWNGTMHPCTRMESIMSEPIKEGFSSAWNRINCLVNVYPRYKKCEECKYAKACSFCPAVNETLGSRYRLDEVWCDRTWKMLQCGLRRLPPECG